MTAAQAAELAKVRLFSELDEETLANVADRAMERNYPRGQIIFSQGDEGGSLYVLLGGLVKVVITGASGDEMLLTTLRAPATFGELALVDGRPRSASVEVGEPARVLIVSRDAWQDLVAAHPQLSDALMRNLASILRRLTDQASDLALLDLPGRVAKMLMRSYEVLGRPSALDMRLTQTDIANMVGGSRQSVNQILGHLANRGYIEARGRIIVIKDPDALRRRAGL
ncbi:MAG: family transcriptional regulator, cyclic receptor protein [Actinomycetota bacterium]|nr:family transcriptional regulator, cyclic receptor protein [Actinomycetota bacterium]MEA2486789.1 family transcriptional regulator, cyclic receptor protein [Actinomycetota bacterium]